MSAYVLKRQRIYGTRLELGMLSDGKAVLCGLSEHGHPIYIELGYDDLKDAIKLLERKPDLEREEIDEKPF